MRYDVGALLYFAAWIPAACAGEHVWGMLTGILLVGAWNTIADRVNGYRWFWWIRGSKRR